MMLTITLLLFFPLAITGGTIASFPNKAWKTAYRPSWPGFLLLAAGWIPFGLPAMISMLVGSLLLSPSKLPIPRRTRLFAGAAALLASVALSIAHVYSEFTS